MKQIHKSVPLPDNPYIDHYFPEHHAFFDIETTGFSPKNAFVYLIGLALRSKNELHIYQFLAEHPSEEPEVLRAFYQKLDGIQTLITFNGLGFDLPFLKGREASYDICGNLDFYQNIDLYKVTGKLAQLFHLPNKKQKSVELFLGIDREDKYSGGELISIYHEYEKKQDSHLESLLLLHNYEDVLGMTKLLSLLAYRDFLESPANVLDARLETCRPYGSTCDEQELLLELQVPMAFPKHFLFQKEFCSLMCQDRIARLLVPVTCGEMKFYYDNYKDYYYLPDEDMAVHKSVASFVDSKHRKKATAATCYTKKSSVFLPQGEAVFSPCFYPEKKSGTAYFALTEDFLSDQKALNLYATHLLKFCQ